jgi:hypothetical protein
MLVCGVLDDARIDIIAAAKNHVLDAIDKEEVAIFIEISDVPSP